MLSPFEKKIYKAAAIASVILTVAIFLLFFCFRSNAQSMPDGYQNMCSAAIGSGSAASDCLSYHSSVTQKLNSVVPDAVSLLLAAFILAVIFTKFFSARRGEEARGKSLGRLFFTIQLLFNKKFLHWLVLRQNKYIALAV